MEVRTTGVAEGMLVIRWVEMANEWPTMVKCHGGVGLDCRRGKLRVLEMWRGVVAVGR